MNRLNLFQKAYDEALAAIAHYQSDPNMAAITQWILTTEVNLYDCLPRFEHANTAESCASLLHTIHHALVDDGDISFPVVNGSPRMSFISRYEDNYSEFVLTETEKEFRARYNKTYTITFLDTVEQFIEHVEQWHEDTTKRHFIHDAKRFGIAFAAQHYHTVTEQQIQEWLPLINS